MGSRQPEGTTRARDEDGGSAPQTSLPMPHAGASRADPREVVVEGEVERITFENVDTGFRVVKIAVAGKVERLAVVGSFPSVGVGARLRVRGSMVTDKKHGEQLRAESVTELAPSTLVGIERYLGSGMIKGVGQRYAQRIVATFGLD